MKVLAINGSPRKKGNTQILLDAAIDEFRNAGAEAETISVADYDIRPCTGCERCYHKFWDCPIGDDAVKVLKKMVYADGLLIGSPVYFGGITAQLKALFDRSSMPYQQSELRDKVGGAIAVGEGLHGGQEMTVGQIVAFFMCHDMIVAPSESGILGAMATANSPGEVRNDPNGIKSARGLAKRMARLLGRR